MAIYTQFGRYEKARAFKHWADTEGDVYMLLGFGNPKWDSIDSSDSSQENSMLVAPYNTSVISYTDSITHPETDPLTYNQFYDVKANMSFIENDNSTVTVNQALIDGVPNTSSNSGKYIDKCKNLIPPFPCWWSVPRVTFTAKETGTDLNGTAVSVSNDSSNTGKYILSVGSVTFSNISDFSNLPQECPIACVYSPNGEIFTCSDVVLSGGDTSEQASAITYKGGTVSFYTDNSDTIIIDLSRYDKYYIIKEDGDYKLYDIDNNSASPTIIVFPTGDTAVDVQKRQYFSELYLRGLAIQNDICHPACLLGAVKCNIDFVRDIGSDESVYTGDINQFWYGDRYWEVVNINEGNEVDGYIDDSKGKSILPCHLAFTVTIPPMFLCGDMKIDQNLSPRQIAIFTRERNIVEGVKKPGPNYYRVYENMFNFGQYYKVDDSDNYTPTAVPDMNMLNFIIPCTTENNDEEHKYQYSNDGTNFKFLLGDYLRGSIKNIHSAERIGYVVGF